MSKRCAYCDRTRVLTREHVWPNCFLERWGRSAAHFSIKAQKVHGADYVVKDVCSDCNMKLGELDGYFCRMYDEYFQDVHDFNARVHLEYDFQLFCRALLKVAYNSARAGGSALEPLRPFRQYILAGADIPEKFALFAELISPSMIPAEGDGHEPQKLLPTAYRSGITKFTKPSGKHLYTRVVAVNSFYFHLVFPFREPAEKEFWEAVADLGRTITGVVRLKPESSKVTLQTSPQHMMSSLAPHLEAHHDQYRKFFEGRDSKGDSK